MIDQKNAADGKSDTRKPVHPLAWFLFVFAVLLLLNTIRRVAWDPDANRTPMVAKGFLDLGCVLIFARHVWHSSRANMILPWMTIICIAVSHVAFVLTTKR